MKDNPIVSKSLAFALRIVKLSRHIADEHKEFTLSREILTSGTGVGKFVILAESGESPESFVLNMAKALQRADENEYWLILIHYAGLLKDHEYESIEADRKELAKMLTSIVKSSKQKTHCKL